MQLCVLKSKIHKAVVTGAELHYEGSLGIDEEFIEACGLLVNERIDVYNVNNGARFSTYVIKEKRGSKRIVLNGAAARLACVGDRIIIASYAYMDELQAKKHKPSIIKIDEDNNIIK